MEVGQDDGIAGRLHAGARAFKRRPTDCCGDLCERATDVRLRSLQISGGSRNAAGSSYGTDCAEQVPGKMMAEIGYACAAGLERLLCAANARHHLAAMRDDQLAL